LLFSGSRLELLYANVHRSPDEPLRISERLSRSDVVANCHPDVAPEANCTAGCWTEGSAGLALGVENGIPFVGATQDASGKAAALAFKTKR
jgi:hypothetical protein